MSWVQYWWEVGYTLRNPALFYGGNLRTDLPMVLFVLYHINKVLPKDKPIWIEAVMANTGWDYVQMALQEVDLVEVHHQLEKELLMEEVNKPAHEYLCEHAAESATRNYELLREVVRDTDRHQQKAIQKDTQAREERRQKERRQRQMDLALHADNHWKDREHAATVAVAKACDKEAVPPPPIPLHLLPQEKTLTMKMPPSPMSSVPVSICHPEATPQRTSSSSEGPWAPGMSRSSPSPMKGVDLLDSTDVIDPLQHFQKYYLPDEAEMDEPDENSRAISEMELEYARIPSTREDQHRGDYSDTPTYHTVPSPNLDDKDGMLEGSTAEVSPGMEAALLRVEDAGKDQPARQQSMLALQ